MLYGIMADIVVLVHLAFVIFAVLGGILIAWRRWIMWLHIPAFLWAFWIELTGGICPLTPLENWFRISAGQGGYQGDFFAAYLLPLLYPAGLTRKIQTLLAFLVIVINVSAYGVIFYRGYRK
ncbi:hypothetical protein D1AOALGA4SA_12756 [Olavius algarvensis Delta 1 endosymbiont]|nr:hypothetical protein D1AOALGA4SA_12756 [Olavius algarvensis Delta 1 endosymbiont]